jgi:hypothetical protein
VLVCPRCGRRRRRSPDRREPNAFDNGGDGRSILHLEPLLVLCQLHSFCGGWVDLEDLTVHGQVFTAATLG